jgi:hypothetical protein
MSGDPPGVFPLIDQITPDPGDMIDVLGILHKSVDFRLKRV